MAFTTAPIDAAPSPVNNTAPNEFDLPSREFVGYDPKGTTSITGSPIVRSDQVIPNQKINNESAEVAESPPAAETVTLSPKISAIARKEQAQRQREAQFRQRERELEAKLADAEKYNQLKSKMAAKDFSAAEELGLTNDEYVQYQLKKIEGQDPSEQRFRRLEEEISQSKKNQEEQTVREYQENQTLWKQDVSKVVKEDEAFADLKYLQEKEQDVESAMLDFINTSFEEDNIEYSTKKTAELFKKAVIERARIYAGMPSLVNEFREAKVLGPPKSQTNTITQNMTVSSKALSTKPFHLMSESEQIAEAYRRVQVAKQQR